MKSPTPAGSSGPMNSTLVGRSLRGYSSSGTLGWMTRSAIWTLQSMKKPRSGGRPSAVRISSAARCASAKTSERTVQCSERFRIRPSAEDDGASPRPKGAVSTEDSESGDTEKTTLARPCLSATSGPDKKAPSATTTSGRTSSTSRSISATQPGTGRRKMLRMSHRSRAMPPLMGSCGVGTWSSSKSRSPRIGRWSAPVAVTAVPNALPVYHVTSCPASTSRRASGRAGFTWPVAGVVVMSTRVTGVPFRVCPEWS